MKRVVAVTGVAGGIGSRVARAFAGAGWYVAGVDLAEPPTDSVDRFVRLDLAGEDAEDALAELMGSLERLDAVVNAAGIQNTGSALDTDDDEWQRIMNVNVRGAFWASRAGLPQLRASGGAVVNVGSVHAIATTPGAAAYAASKGALLSLTRSLALEWAPRVRVNCVVPGAVDTPMLTEGLTRSPERSAAEGRLALERGIPLGRVGQPDEVAQAVLFLADGERSSFVTGQSIVVDGGVLASLGTP